MNGPIIQGERARLEPASETLIEMYCRWFADPEVNLYTLRFPPSRAMAAEWLEKMSSSNTDVLWAVARDGRVVGMVQIDTINWQQRRAEVAVIIGEKSEWGKGIATDALRLIVRYAFEELNLEKLQGEAVAENIGSIRALEKAGFRQLGLARKHFYQNGRWSDMWLGEVLRDEWEGQDGDSLPR